jgi:hypothetical protein
MQVQVLTRTSSFSTLQRQHVADKGVSKIKEQETAMIITIAVSDAVIRVAQERGQSVEDFVEALIDKGMATTTGRPAVTDAMEKIRALRLPTVSPRR